MLVITATASHVMRKKLKDMLSLNTAIEFVDSPDRNNIKLSVKKVKSRTPIDVIFSSTIANILQRQKACERMLIFCRTVDDCGRLYAVFMCHLNDPCKQYVNMYHSNTYDHVKQMIHADMLVENGSIRVLICTSAAGLGVNFKGIKHVIHYGPPYTIDSLVQQIGRCSRDGQQGFHLLLYSLIQCRKIDNEIKSYLSSNVCRRQALMDFYGGQCEIVIKHFCCDNCTLACECNTDDCSAYRYHPIISEEDEDDSLYNDDQSSEASDGN